MMNENIACDDKRPDARSTIIVTIEQDGTTQNQLGTDH